MGTLSGPYELNGPTHKFTIRVLYGLGQCPGILIWALRHVLLLVSLRSAGDDSTAVPSVRLAAVLLLLSSLHCNPETVSTCVGIIPKTHCKNPFCGTLPDAPVAAHMAPEVILHRVPYTQGQRSFALRHYSFSFLNYIQTVSALAFLLYEHIATFEDEVDIIWP